MKNEKALTGETGGGFFYSGQRPATLLATPGSTRIGLLYKNFYRVDRSVTGAPTPGSNLFIYFSKAFVIN
jgi:hypothetical protein